MPRPATDADAALIAARMGRTDPGAGERVREQMGRERNTRRFVSLEGDYFEIRRKTGRLRGAFLVGAPDATIRRMARLMVFGCARAADDWPDALEWPISGFPGDERVVDAYIALLPFLRKQWDEGMQAYELIADRLGDFADWEARDGR